MTYALPQYLAFQAGQFLWLSTQLAGGGGGGGGGGRVGGGDGASVMVPPPQRLQLFLQCW